MNARSVVIYYTWAGHTREMAEIIAAQTGADIMEIHPEKPYSQDYNDCVKQAKKEIKAEYLPPIQHIGIDLDQYDIVYCGTPIWWGTMAPPLATFLHENKLEGKTVLPFSTHGGGGKGRSDRDMEKLCRGANVLPMHTTYEGGGRNAEKEIIEWLEKTS